MKNLPQIALVVIGCLAVAGTTYVLRLRNVRAAATNFKEYTLVRAETSRAQGPHVFERLLYVAKRADGSRAEGEVSAEDSERSPSRFVMLVPERIQATVNDRLRAKSTLYYKDAPAPKPSVPDAECGVSRLSPAANATYQGEEEVFGFRTAVIRTEYQLGPESYVNSAWKAIDLDCATLKVREERRDSGGNVTGRFEINAVKVVLGTPDASLFDVPEDYEEMPPSRLRAALVASAAGAAAPPSPSTINRLEKEDQEYFANHRNAGLR